MYYIFPLFGIHSYLLMLLAVTAITGDYIVVHTKLHFFQALFDNTTHAFIGGLSWLMVCIKLKNHFHFKALLEIALCAFIASLIDVDHFLAARSLSLKVQDATNLHKRPPLHCTTIPVATCLLLLAVSYAVQAKVMKTGALIVLTAFVSHHTRDATRRGYWLHPFGSTPPIPYFVYVGLTCAIPYAICVLHQSIKIAGGHSSRISNASVI